MRKVAGSLAVPVEEVVVGLAAHDDAGVAVRAEDDRRARLAVVVVGHRVAVAAGRRRDDDVAGRGSLRSAPPMSTSPDSQCLPARWQYVPWPKRSAISAS